MNHLKTNPVGIDVVINRIQSKIYNNLVSKWGSLDVYGRCYKKEDRKGLELEVYTGVNEYAPVLYSEGNKVFFIQGDKPSNNNGTITNDLWVVAILNIEEIRELTHRGDEEAHADLIQELTNTDSEINGLEYGMNNLKRVVEDSFSFGNFKFSDIHPYHVFMVKLSVEYNLYKNNC